MLTGGCGGEKAETTETAAAATTEESANPDQPAPKATTEPENVISEEPVTVAATPPSTSITPAPAAHSGAFADLRQTVTDQLGAGAAEQLINALNSLQADANTSSLQSALSDLANSIGQQDVSNSLNSLASLTQNDAVSSLNLGDLKDTVSIGSASILNDAFDGSNSSSGSIPPTIAEAIDQFKTGDLAGGGAKLFRSLGDGSLTDEQTAVIDQIVTSALPVLGEQGEQMRDAYLESRKIQEQGHQVKDAADAIKSLF